MEIEDKHEELDEDTLSEVHENADLLSNLALRVSHYEEESTVLTLAIAFAQACGFHGIPAEEYYDLIEKVQEDVHEQVCDGDHEEPEKSN